MSTSNLFGTIPESTFERNSKYKKKRRQKAVSDTDLSHSQSATIMIDDNPLGIVCDEVICQKSSTFTMKYTTSNTSEGNLFEFCDAICLTEFSYFSNRVFGYEYQRVRVSLMFFFEFFFYLRSRPWALRGWNWILNEKSVVFLIKTNIFNR